MKLLRYVISDEEAQLSNLKPDEDCFESLLSDKFGISSALHLPILALSTSPNGPESTRASLALKRIKRHLDSLGIFGQGFSAIVAKYGGGAEIAQVSCRAGAVGGGIYVLGRGIRDIKPNSLSKAAHEVMSDETAGLLSISLSSGDVIKTKFIVGSEDDLTGKVTKEPKYNAVPKFSRSTRSITIIDGSLSHLFPPTSDNGMIPAGAVVVLERNSDARLSPSPIYLIVHSADSGKCPSGQCKSI